MSWALPDSVSAPKPVVPPGEEGCGLWWGGWGAEGGRPWCGAGALPAQTGLAEPRALSDGTAQAHGSFQAWLFLNALFSGSKQTAMATARRSAKETDAGRETSNARGLWK